MCLTVRFEVVHGRFDPLNRLRGAADQAHATLERQARREETLNHRVVEIAGDALPVLYERELLQARVEPGVLDGYSGGASEGHDQLLIDVGEHLGGRLLGQVQVAEHLVAEADRHAEERVHRRVVRREAIAVGMLAEIGEPQRLGIDNEQTQDAMTLRQVSDRTMRVIVDANGDELGEEGARLVEHAERAVASIDQVGGGFDDAPEQGGQVETRADCEHGFEKSVQLSRAGELRHPASQYSIRGRRLPRTSVSARIGA